MWNTYCKFAVNDIKNTIFILLLSHWMISLVLPACLAGLVLCLSQKVFGFRKSRLVTLGRRLDGSKFSWNASGAERVPVGVRCLPRKGPDEEVVLTEKEGKFLERERWSVIHDCRKGKGQSWMAAAWGNLDHLEDSKMRQSSEGTWVEQLRENAGCLSDDKRVSSAVELKKKNF